MKGNRTIERRHMSLCGGWWPRRRVHDWQLIKLMRFLFIANRFANSTFPYSKNSLLLARNNNNSREESASKRGLQNRIHIHSRVELESFQVVLLCWSAFVLLCRSRRWVFRRRKETARPPLDKPSRERESRWVVRRIRELLLIRVTNFRVFRASPVLRKLACLQGNTVYQLAKNPALLD